MGRDLSTNERTTNSFSRKTPQKFVPTYRHIGFEHSSIKLKHNDVFRIILIVTTTIIMVESEIFKTFSTYLNFILIQRSWHRSMHPPRAFADYGHLQKLSILVSLKESTRDWLTNLMM